MHKTQTGKCAKANREEPVNIETIRSSAPRPLAHYNVSSLPIMAKGEQFLRVIGIFTLYVATIKLAYNENNP